MKKNDLFHPFPTKEIRHIGIIPDGGRRWAKANNHALISSYNETRKKMAEFVVLLKQMGIPEISVYLSSRENFKRIDNEIAAFNTAAFNAIKDVIPQMAILHKIKITIAGDVSNLSDDFVNLLNNLVYNTRNFDLIKLNLLISYNPADEIKHALNQAVSDDITQSFWVKTPLDLVIRTGGANLLSNFLPLQAGYARLYFSDKLFNDFTPNDLMEYIEHYTSLTRKYGD
ncbi:MAG: polyprenyl diphosphate synthase [Lentimicrobium sp.]|jgi:undecaprenyl diphosphate synthase|nr:polyprenyl diphosphate synthase [Lentimicrobium sp.]